MRARECSRTGLRIVWLFSFLLASVFLPSTLHASALADTARQLAHKIAAASGPGAFAIEITNRSSLPERSAREVRSALETQLQSEGVHTTKTEQSMGTIEVVLSESLRDYVWTAEVAIGSDEKKVSMVALPRSFAGAPFAPALPIILKTSLLFLTNSPCSTPRSSTCPEVRACSCSTTTGRDLPAFRSQRRKLGLEAAPPIAHTRSFPRDLRGRLLLRRDHLFGRLLARNFLNHFNAAMPLTLVCNDSDDPWPDTRRR